MCKIIDLIFLFLVIFKNKVSCCEQETFNNTAVTVLGVRGVDTVSGCLKPIGPLQKATYIQIVNETVPVLYKGAVSDLPNLVDLILDNNGITTIMSGAFNNLSMLHLLRLKSNSLKEIKLGVFNNLNVVELNLMNNSISVIETGAFDNMPRLSVIILDENKIMKWNKDWFTNTPQVSTLSFKNNLIAFIPAKAFQNIKGVHYANGRNVSTNIYLSENKISYVDSHALEGLETVGWLFLNRNEIVELPDDMLEPVHNIEWLKLSFNKLTCVPDKIFQKIPSVSLYLDGNPLTEECKVKVKEYKNQST